MDTPQASNNTKLKSRTLWFDGDSSYPAETIQSSFLLGNTVFVDVMTEEIKQYNQLVAADKRIAVKTEMRHDAIDLTWCIPKDYINLNITEYLIDKLDAEHWTNSDDLEKRVIRVVKELKLYKNHGLLDVLRVLIYVINTLSSNSVVWGVGRGSSVSSYVLYLIGVHDVDSVMYDLDIEDFLH